METLVRDPQELEGQARDGCSPAEPHATVIADPRKVALAVALVLSSSAASANSMDIAATTYKPVLKSFVEQACASRHITGSRPPDAAHVWDAYGRNFENYGRNFENYAKNFENYARNFENYGRNFENPAARARALGAYQVPLAVAMLPNGDPVPECASELLAAIANRAF